MTTFGKTIGGAILTLALVLGITTTAGSTAVAQYGDSDDRYERGNGRGHHKKDKKWKHKRNRDDDDGDWDDRDWRQGRRDGRYDNNGVRNRGRGNGRGYGNRDIYNDRDVYNNTAQVELNRGYQQGLNTGASDARRGQSYSPERSRHYRNASSQAFREGFVRGYDEGYRQYDGYNNGTYDNGRGGIGTILGGILGLP